MAPEYSNSLLNASKSLQARTSSTLLHRGNSLRGMGKRTSWIDVLAENLERYMAALGIKSEPALAKLSKVSQRSINNIRHRRHDPYLSTIYKLAAAFGIEPHQLLCPIEDDKFLALCKVWAQSDERGRDDLHAIAEAMLKKHDSREPEEDGRRPAANSGRG